MLPLLIYKKFKVLRTFRNTVIDLLTQRSRKKVVGEPVYRYVAKPGVGNFLCPRATLRLFRCLAGQIPVKKANI